MTLLVRPSADSIDGGWTNELGGTVLFSSIDEASVDDADFIRSEDNPTTDLCRIKLEVIASAIEEPFDVNYRYKKVGSGTINLIARLIENTTTIAEWAHTNIADTFVTANQTLTTPQFEAITDFTDLYIEFEANPVMPEDYLALADGTSLLLLADGTSQLILEGA